MLTKDEYEALPEKAKAGFALDEESGEYVPVKDAKLKQTLNELDSKFKALEQEHRKQGETLAEFEARKKKELEEARAKALEEAESASDIKKIKQYVMWSQVIGVIKIILILAPIIFAILYLPPYFKQLLDSYQKVLPQGLNINQNTAERVNRYLQTLPKFQDRNNVSAQEF